MLSQTAEYALRAMVHIATEEGEGEGEALRAEEISDALGVPRNYLSKILHALAREGLLESTRGPRGGFRLAIPAEALPLGRIVRVFDPRLLAEEQRCLMGQTVCSDENACAAHDQWKQVARTVRAFFSRTSLEDLASGNAGDPTNTRSWG